LLSGRSLSAVADVVYCCILAAHFPLTRGSIFCCCAFLLNGIEMNALGLHYTSMYHTSTHLYKARQGKARQGKARQGKASTHIQRRESLPAMLAQSFISIIF
jgi:hypothetical protein